MKNDRNLSPRGYVAGRHSRKMAMTTEGVDIGKRKLFDYWGKFFWV